MTNSERRYDIDWLRVIAIGLLLIYHTGIGFQPWGVFIQFIQNNESLYTLWYPMSMMNIWRIPLLFFVSGMGVSFAMRKRDWNQLIIERSRRILLPFVFGMVFIVPLHIFLWQDYYSQDLAYAPGPSHLWFLGYIFLYVLLLSPVFYLVRKHEESRWIRRIKAISSHPMGFVITCAVLFGEAILVKPEIYEAYAMSFHGFMLGLAAFFFGFVFVLSGESFRKMTVKWRWAFLALAVSLFLFRAFAYSLKAPLYLLVIESTSWIYALFGLASRYLNKPSRTLSYLSQAAYPVYIIHMIVLYLASYLLFPLSLSPWIKFAGIILFTFAGCFALYDLIIRRIYWIRPLFGLKKAVLKKSVDKAVAGESLIIQKINT